MRVLVVDDEKAIRESLREILEEDGYEVVEAPGAAVARKEIGRGVDLVLLDIALGDDNGVDLLREFCRDHPQTPVIMVTGHGTVALAAEAFKLGAHDFMEKPLRLLKVRAAVRNALESVALRQRVAQAAREKYPKAVYGSAVMRELFSQALRLAGVSAPVVIVGPSGSGKEHVAQALHYEGPRADGPFVATNSASMPPSLAEDELFGHERGAFTDAHVMRKGCLEQADCGTLFLDEIADMDPQVQAKLLRVLETGSFTRLGGTKPVVVNVRVIAATHKDIEALVRQGAFRHDLWFRLCAFVLRVPSLDERREDIPLLAGAFLDTVCAEMNLKRHFTPDALELLSRHQYPGNVRQLKHAVTRAVVFSEHDEIDAAQVCQALGTSVSATGASFDQRYGALAYHEAREQFERDYFEDVLRRHEGNITAAAAAIGMAQSNLSRRLKELGIRAARK